MDSPNLLRGKFYSTHLFSRCTNFRQCPLCGCCRNYNKYISKCIECEDRKRPKTICRCTDDNIYHLKVLEDKLKTSLMRSRDKEKNGIVNLGDASDQSYESIIEGLAERNNRNA